MIRVHTFSSTGEAYDACQCDDNVKDGDTLLIPSERVVGVADTWPFAVTTNLGELHGLIPGTDPSDIKPEYAAAVDAAIAVAREHGFM